MTSLMISVRVVVPIFLLLLLGALIRRLNWVDEPTLKKMDLIGFRILLPAQMFYSLYNADRDFTKYAVPLLTAIGVIGIIFIVALLLFTKLEKDPRRRGPMIQCVIRVNFVIFGMAIVASLYGAERTGLLAMIAAFIIPFTSTASAVLFEIYRGGKIEPKKLMINIAKNPYLISAVLGISFLLLQIPLPMVVTEVIQDVGGMATPYCLIVLGGSIHLSKMGEYKRPLWIAVISKSVVIPLVFTPIMVAMGFRGEVLATLAIMMACPTAVSGFTLANQCGADGELAGELVIITTLCSMVSIFLTIWILTAMALI